MDATPLLSSLLAALAEARLEAVLIGDVAAALHGATTAVVGGQSVLVAALEDILKSKKAVGRERDRAVIPILEQTLRATRTR